MKWCLNTIAYQPRKNLYHGLISKRKKLPYKTAGVLEITQTFKLQSERFLKKMNASIVELKNNYEHSDYCGSSLLQEPSPRYKTLAPNLFKDPIFKPCSFEEQEKILSKHAEQYSTVFVGCYCTGCLEGIQRMNSRFSSSQTEAQTFTTQANSKKLKPVHIASLVVQSLASL